MADDAMSPVYGDEATRNELRTLGVLRREVRRLIALREGELEDAEKRGDRTFVMYRKGQLDALHRVRRMIPEKGQP